MATCEQCGNEYDKTMEIRLDGRAHTFDSFECAIEVLAPRCANCSVRIVGHGVEATGTMYCSASCARNAGVQGIQDRQEART